jgi:hypothetical protein
MASSGAPLSLKSGEAVAPQAVQSGAHLFELRPYLAIVARDMWLLSTTILAVRLVMPGSRVVTAVDLSVLATTVS